MSTSKQVKLSPLPIFEVTAQNEDIGVIRKHPGLLASVIRILRYILIIGSLLEILKSFIYSLQ